MMMMPRYCLLLVPLLFRSNVTATDARTARIGSNPQRQTTWTRGEDSIDITIFIVTDNSPHETYWRVDQTNLWDSEKVAGIDPGSYQQPQNVMKHTIGLDVGELYSFNIIDKFGDGIRGDGYYQVYLGTQNVDDTSAIIFASNGDFAYEQEHVFLAYLDAIDPLEDSATFLTIEIQFDENPEEVGWILRSDTRGSTNQQGDATIAFRPPCYYGSNVANQVVRERVPVNGGNYFFVLTDFAGNGLCCDNGSGSYTIWQGSVEDEDLLIRGDGRDKPQEVSYFSTTFSPLPPPTNEPSFAFTPTDEPSSIAVTDEPSGVATEVPLPEPTESLDAPFPEPTETPSAAPTEKTEAPSDQPMFDPTRRPTPDPTSLPPPDPTNVPTAEPTELQSLEPNEESPTEPPSSAPNESPTAAPSDPFGTTVPPTLSTNAPTPAPAVQQNVTVRVELTLDSRPEETGWRISDSSSGEIINVPPGTYSTPNTTVQETVSLEPGQSYLFTAIDSVGYNVFLERSQPVLLVEGDTEEPHWFVIGDNFPITLALQTDQYPEEIAWRIDRLDLDEGIASVGIFPNGTYQGISSQLVEQTIMGQEDGVYRFAISDSAGDGTCCKYGAGNYSIYVGSVDTSNESNAIVSESGNYKFGAQHLFHLTRTPRSEPSNASLLLLEIMFDDYPEEISWVLKADDTDTAIARLAPKQSVIEFGPLEPYTSDLAGSTTTHEIQIPIIPRGSVKDFTLIMTDVVGHDGLCCFYGRGSYILYFGDKSNDAIVTAGRLENTSREVRTFTLSGDGPSATAAIGQPSSSAVSRRVRCSLVLACIGGAWSTRLLGALTAWVLLF